ncbi:MAG: Uma2 family endonuclease [Anaerolineae bacterium]|nr:Uma2 family endonuclease [Anaerolineae bacterium]
MRPQKKLLTVEQFWVEYAGQPYELIRGRVVPVAPTDFAHSVVTSRVVALLCARADPSRTGGVITVDAGFMLGADTVCSADCAFLSQEQVASMPEPDTYVPFAPVLAVEVVSSHDTAAIIRAKVAQYRAAGTQLIWVIYPNLRKVDVYLPDGCAHELDEGDTLDGGDALPNVRIAVTELFPSG